MAKSRPSVQKRNREARNHDKKAAKAARKAARDAARDERDPEAVAGDPDLAGIKPGPQPVPWAEMIEDLVD